MPDTGLIVAAGFFLVLVLALFLVMRQLMLWYWKVNEVVELLRSIDTSLQAMPAARQHRAALYRASGGKKFAP